VKTLLHYFFSVVALIPFSSITYAQAPNIAYAPNPSALSTGIAFSISPSNSGGAVPANGFQVTTLVSTAATGGAPLTKLNNPEAVATDGAGNIYVADDNNNLIRKITPAGVMTNLAGGAVGFANGEHDATGASAEFNSPDGIAYDGAGNLYVADAGGDVIRKIVIATGVVTTYAGIAGVANLFNGATPLLSKFSGPAGLAFDASGNLYIADQGNSVIREITSAGTVSTLAGSGAAGYYDATGTAAKFNSPNDVVADGSGNLFVADYQNNVVRKIVISTKVVTTYAGTNGSTGTTDGTGAAAKFSRVVGITIDASGNLFVVDQDNNLIRLITPGPTFGTVSTIAGSGAAAETDGTGALASFNAPIGLEVDNLGNLYVIDVQSFATGSVRKVLLTGGYAISPALPAGLAFDATTGIIRGTPAAAFAATTYTITALNVSGSSTTTLTLSCTNPVINQWLGFTNGNWATGTNWSAGASPTAAQTVEIGVTAYTGARAQPTFSGIVPVKAIVFGTLNTPTLTIPAGLTLTATNGLTVNTGSTAIINGPGILSIAGASTITGTLTASLNAVISLAGGSLTNSGTFTLSSDANGSSSIAAIPAGSYVNGTVNVQRYLTGGNGYRTYRLISSPVYVAAVNGNNVYSLNYLQNSIWLTGSAGGGFDKTGNPTLYLFREDQVPSNATFTSGNFWGISKINNPNLYDYYLNGGATVYNIPAGNGYMAFFRGDKSKATVGVETLPNYVPVTVTLSTAGTLNQGQLVVHNWYTPASATIGYTGAGVGTNAAIRGFNLIGNPYPSSIDWSKFSSTTPGSPIYGLNVDPTVWTFDPATKNYATYNAVSGIITGNGGKVIASGQGFFVHANALLPTLTFQEAAKTSTQVTAGSTLLLGTPVSQTAYNSYLRLKMITDSVNYSDMVIGFNSTSATKYNPIEDSEFLLGSGAPEAISGMSSDNIHVSVKWLPLPKNSLNQVIKLNVSAAASGLYTIERTDFKEIPAIYELWLMDNYKKDSLDIRHNTTYAFNININDTASYGNNRFRVVIREDRALGLHLLNFAATKVTDGSEVVWKTENEQNYTNFTVERSIDNGVNFDVMNGLTSSGLGTYSYLDKAPVNGADQYRLKLVDLNGTVTYSKIVTLMYGNLSNSISNNAISVYPNPAKSTLNLTISPALNSSFISKQSTKTVFALAATVNTNTVYQIKIVSNIGSVIKNTSTSEKDWQTDLSNLMPGTYVIQVINNNDKSLVGQKTFIKL
jgi:trimeric autotransporter adhesin